MTNEENTRSGFKKWFDPDRWQDEEMEHACFIAWQAARDATIDECAAVVKQHMEGWPYNEKDSVLADVVLNLEAMKE
jgi:hypothetical protein